jgi:hypothetical protein
VSHGRGRLICGGSAGSILLEVMMATLLVGVLVVPLATSFAGVVGEARTVRQRAEGNPAGRAPSQSAEGWEWGPRVIAGWWRPGPALHLRVSGATGDSSADVEVGLWANGWLLAHESVVLSGRSGPPATNDLQLGPELWTGLADSELVVRVRTVTGAWGPPWRLVVPEPGAGTPAPGAALPAPPQGPSVIVHRPVIGTSSLTATWNPADLASPPFGLLFSLSPAIEGWGGATLDGRTQWWLMEEGRSVDLYF